MPDLQSLIQQSGYYGPVVLFTIAVFLILEVVFSQLLGRRRRQGLINRRLILQSEAGHDSAEALAQLRKERGLSADGAYTLPIIALNRLLTQSGVRISAVRLMVIMVAVAVGVTMLVSVLTARPVMGALIGLGLGLVLPVLVLRILRGRRQRKLEEQLPEAIDVMVRSLRAGHPIPVAVSMVAREMSDPVGTEFGMTSDEMMYGSDLETAMTNLKARAGQGDLGFLVVALSVQAKTGGNLAEILGNLANMIRQRFRMRRKIVALSSEGRFSAIALSLIPIVIHMIIEVLAPTYYGDVRTHPVYIYGNYLAITLWVMGVYVMRRMVSFKF